ncbi:MAG: ATP-dependent helicase RecG [Oscillospiraceae bacterium]|jgi:ATP-dependent DNA helicase RecG|nr:ATP-dependent helicase RecG [Oscillospiraceae bacterium]
MADLFSPVKYLKGVGEKRAELYAKLGIYTIYDLLWHIPRGYVDYSSPVKISQAENDLRTAVEGVVKKKFPEATANGIKLYKVLASDGENDFKVVFFNNRYAYDALGEGKSYIFYGKVSGNLLSKEIISPTFIPAEQREKLVPVYPLTAGLSEGIIRLNIKSALSCLDGMYDYLPKEVQSENLLCTLSYAFENIHFPEDERALSLAKKRLSFDELFILQIGMLFLKRKNRSRTGFKMQRLEIDEFFDSIPFELTGAQKRAINEAVSDMCSEIPMNRLLQGDVGSGKTAVAAAICYFAHKNGCQSALMAPTEILAAQHFNTLRSFLEPLGVNVCLLTGSVSQKEKEKIKKLISQGDFSVAVGTQALIQNSVEFKNLGLVIADEQHRFGVMQRASLSGKGKSPHRLVISATPIPRTLGLIVYGDLDISILDELPKGRFPVETYAVMGKLRERAFGFVKKQLSEGRQAYVVCPMIEENELTEGLKAAKSYAEEIKKIFSGFEVGLLHGKMKPSEKEKIMSDFKEGRIRLLVSTTVIEVGVDVPNANIMLIENADRFGLSQLHQLRGRVGRGSHKSYCVLLTDNLSAEARERLKIIASTSDGFEIAKQDMKLRGCGDFFGERQHGLPLLKIAELDSEMLSQARNSAIKTIKSDPELLKHPKLKAEAERLFKKAGEDIFN